METMVSSLRRVGTRVRVVEGSVYQPRGMRFPGRRFCNLSLVAAVLICLVPESCSEAAQRLNGRWRVTTRLVAAQDAINQGYTVGSIRKERWKISGSKRKAKLKTPSGRIRGKAVGKAWRFLQDYNTGYGIILRMDIVARARGKSRMAGTIKARYYSTQFGYLVGIDAWSFKGRKR